MLMLLYYKILEVLMMIYNNLDNFGDHNLAIDISNVPSGQWPGGASGMNPLALKIVTSETRNKSCNNANNDQTSKQQRNNINQR